jgi:hypothetical protein
VGGCFTRKGVKRGFGLVFIKILATHTTMIVCRNTCRKLGLRVFFGDGVDQRTVGVLAKGTVCSATGRAACLLRTGSRTARAVFGLLVCRIARAGSRVRAVAVRRPRAKAMLVIGRNGQLDFGLDNLAFVKE